MRIKPKPGEPLWPSEVVTLQHIANGLKAPDVAQVRYVSPNTIRTHLRCIAIKLGTCSAANAVAVAMRQGIIK